MRQNRRILGLEVEWRVNILALIAFLLSLASVIYNIIGYFEGARIEQNALTQVILYAHQDPDITSGYTRQHFDHQILTFISTMRYRNLGRPRYKDRISNARITFTLPDGSGPYSAEWHNFVRFDPLARKLIFDESVSDLVIAGENAIGRETWFVPRLERDRITISDFREQFEPALMGEEMEWSLTFQSRSALRGETADLTGVCNVRLGPRTVQSLSDPQVRWVALNCL